MAKTDMNIKNYVCKNCIYFRNNSCFRYPPTIMHKIETTKVSLLSILISKYFRVHFLLHAKFPPVDDYSCCGEFILNNQKEKNNDK